jgi:hypothetical protein
MRSGVLIHLSDVVTICCSVPDARFTAQRADRSSPRQNA